MVCKV